MKNFIIGTRGSKLALTQAEIVLYSLKKAHPSVAFEIKKIKTKADKLSKTALGDIEGEGLFTKEIEQALLTNEIDIGVHSLKDLPLDINDALTAAAVLKRDDPKDALVAKEKNITLVNLAKGATLGTSSPRRIAQVLRIRADLKIIPIRGNIDTRLRKVKEDGLDAIIIAACGLKRLGLEGEIAEYISFDTMLPCVGQGAIAIEIRKADSKVKEMVSVLHDKDTFFQIQAERVFLKCLGGGCRTPIGAVAEVEGDTLRLRGIVLSEDGKDFVKSEVSARKEDAARIGMRLADTLIKMGANKLLLCS